MKAAASAESTRWPVAWSNCCERMVVFLLGFRGRPSSGPADVLDRGGEARTHSTPAGGGWRGGKTTPGRPFPCRGAGTSVDWAVPLTPRFRRRGVPLGWRRPGADGYPARIRGLIRDGRREDGQAEGDPPALPHAAHEGPRRAGAQAPPGAGRGALPQGAPRLAPQTESGGAG